MNLNNCKTYMFSQDPSHNLALDVIVGQDAIESGWFYNYLLDLLNLFKINKIMVIKA